MRERKTMKGLSGDMNKESYQEYLKIAHWKSTRAIKLFKVSYKCENCGSGRRLQVHHKNYDHLYNELMSDLKVVCDFCHDKIEHTPTGECNSYYQLVAGLAESKRFNKEIFKSRPGKLDKEFLNQFLRKG